ncbi:uncharacterized protein (DUF427 family) [Streptomyces sp. B3I7]|jgi:uncharacterized protein (DUF427 family)|uniref:DUF427 domain-containing protein n=1 Tax=unclassified Streptomyces TaxID=2593676 RepID=UPI00277EF8CD|nr:MULTISPECIES: DUF427 domain-containing protein [unclassified Streptomyces]MDQ0789359.1 uncharacterized protein (DUF427 family) [Streptomyces sp. B3I8]MDQ0811029.1 uncharacterized protein (DUF427 family) [Streptomyces sp. B3I7]
MSKGHVITVEQSDERVRVVHDGQVLAESDRPLVLRETGCPPRFYLPPEDVRLDLLTPSATHTVCPFKGTASYWSLPDAADLVWAYPDPKPDVAAIKDHLCFYEVEVVGTTAT